MRQHLGITGSTCFVLALTLLLTAALQPVALAQTGDSPGAGGSSTSASASARLTLEKRTAEPETSGGPVPFNILDQADEDMYLALLAWSSKYRIGLGVQDGDWVRYESTSDPKETLEIRVSKTEAGDTWVVETRTGADGGGRNEMHALFSKGKPKLLQAFRVDESGARTDVEMLEDKVAGELFLEARQIAFDALSARRDEIRVTGCGDQELVGPFGTMNCKCLEVQVAEDVDPLSFARQRRWLSEGNLVWLNEGVPRLMPMSGVILPSILFPDDMMSVPGGMVRSPFHVLVDYKGRS